MKASEIAGLLESRISGNFDAWADTVDDIKGDKENSLSFISDPAYLKYLSKTNASILLVQDTIDTSEIDSNFLKKDRAYIVVKDAYRSFIKLIYKMIPDAINSSSCKITDKMISDTAKISDTAIIYKNVFIDEDVHIGKRTVLYPGVVILKNTIIGDDVVLYPNVSVYQNSKIGNRVIIGASTVIGSDGFGFIKDDDGSMLKVPHIGGVIIEDDVEVGSNTSIDRGTLGNTIIKKGAKIDNLVQIAHNCIVGENNILCGMVGLSGSTELGNNVIMGAGSGTKGHIKIGDNCIVTARTSISKDLKPGSEVKGMYPARPLAEELKVQTLVGRLPELYERLKKLEKGGKNG
ncbi:MAG: UDP-3-O-(3-hydroxymyristoyl)glucosamine N-acyltransferase [Proteobacteria bacterium]|nr:UDP-3-O-(3-hydroxymyristoyl)glucosamine N-acyltransferase [Pseudomonadota bacterium]